MIDKIKAWFPEEDFIKVPGGFDDAIIGIESLTMRLIYSTSKCLEILQQEMDEEDANEYFNYNIAGAYMGEKTPIFCEDAL